MEILKYVKGSYEENEKKTVIYVNKICPYIIIFICRAR